MKQKTHTPTPQSQKPLPQEELPLAAETKTSDLLDQLNKATEKQQKTYWTCAYRFSVRAHGPGGDLQYFKMGTCNCTERMGIMFNSTEEGWTEPVRCDSKGYPLEPIRV